MREATNMIDSVHNLENAGMSRPQAEALTRLLRDSVTEAVQHLATKAELADLREHVDAQHMETKTELADLREHVNAQHMETKAELAELKAELVGLKAAQDAQAARSDSQIVDLRGELKEKISANLKYTTLTISLSTVAVISALFYTMPTGG